MFRYLLLFTTQTHSTYTDTLLHCPQYPQGIFKRLTSRCMHMCIQTSFVTSQHSIYSLSVSLVDSLTHLKHIRHSHKCNAERSTNSSKFSCDFDTLALPSSLLLAHMSNELVMLYDNILCIYVCSFELASL